MNMVDLFRAMLPPVSYDLNGKYISAELTAEADVMEVVKASAARVLTQITPLQASMTLSDWERVYGVIPREGATQQERRQNILVKMAATGAVNPLLQKPCRQSGLHHHHYGAATIPGGDKPLQRPPADTRNPLGVAGQCYRDKNTCLPVQNGRIGNRRTADGLW